MSCWSFLHRFYRAGGNTSRLIAVHAASRHKDCTLCGLVFVRNGVLCIGRLSERFQNSLIGRFGNVRDRQAIHFGARLLATAASDAPRRYQRECRKILSRPAFAPAEDFPGVRRFPVVAPATPVPIIFKKVLLSILTPLYSFSRVCFCSLFRTPHIENCGCILLYHAPDS